MDLDVIGVHEDYQGKKHVLEVFLHGTELAQPLYKLVGLLDIHQLPYFYTDTEI